MTSTPFDESLLILSDVHLGNDLNDFPRGGARRAAEVDTDLARLLDHYRTAPPLGRRWRLIIAGDFIDFIGMAIFPAKNESSLESSDEERAHGLGNTSDHGRAKLRAVHARHRVVFEALADFVAAGHALTIIHGNHDVEFHWDAVKEDLRAMLTESAGRATRDGASPQGDLGARIEFAPWFYYVGGVAYVEHGHQYDTLCSTEHVMTPLSPLDPRRIARSFSDVLLRWVVRPTRGVPEYGHDRLGLPDYLLIGVRLGAFGLARLASRFTGAVIELFRVRRAYLSATARELAAEQERRMGALAQATRIGIDRLRALAALQVPPVTRSIPKILASVLLDRLALSVFAFCAIATIAVAGAGHRWCWPAVAGILVCSLGAHRWLSAQRRAWFGDKLDNNDTLVDRAGHLAQLFPAAFVVMGHTHTPAFVSVAEGAATYVNVGSWHEPEPTPGDPSPGYRAARTHLVIHPAPSGPVGHFLAWGEQGPHVFAGAVAVTPARPRPAA
ncbi:MAG: hypothetical protein M3O50_08655 [Myxococcota bacterium]|nr:hypothetical protein [Myxococcota bacterium]